MSKPGTPSVASVDNCLTVLELLKDEGEAGVTELARELSLSKSTVHSHLRTLERRGYVVNGTDGYQVGLRWLDYGGQVQKNQDLFRVGQGEADELAERTGELVALTACEFGESVYVYQAKGQKALNINSHVGVRLPLHCTAAGKAMLSQYSEDEVSAIVEDSGLAEKTENTITDLDALLAELDEIRNRGFALDDEERIEGTRGIGAPISLDNGASPVGAVAICGPPTRVGGDRFRSELPEMVQQTAKVIEVNLMYRD